MDGNIGGRAYLVEKLRERGASRRQAVRLLNGVFREIKRALARGEDVEFAGGRLVRISRFTPTAYRGWDWPAHWQYWTVRWAPSWETLQQLVGLEEAERMAGDFLFDEEFWMEYELAHGSARAKTRRMAKRMAEERKESRKSGK